MARTKKPLPPITTETTDGARAPGLAHYLIGEIDANDSQNWPNEKIGRHLLAARLAAEAEERGLNPATISAAQAEKWIAQIAAQEAAEEGNSSPEKVFRKAAQGAFEEAGRLYKGFLFRRAKELSHEASARTLKAKLAASKGNAAQAAAAATKYTAAAKEEWRRLAQDPKWAKHSKAKKAELIAKACNLPAGSLQTIRKSI